MNSHSYTMLVLKLAKLLQTDSDKMACPGCGGRPEIIRKMLVEHAGEDGATEIGRALVSNVSSKGSCAHHHMSELERDHSPETHAMKQSVSSRPLLFGKPSSKAKHPQESMDTTTMDFFF